MDRFVNNQAWRQIHKTRIAVKKFSSPGNYPSKDKYSHYLVVPVK